MSQTWGQFENFRSSAQRVTRIATRDHNARYLLAEPTKIADTIRSIAFTGIPQMSRVGMWRGGCRPNISVSAPFVWRCLSGSTLTPFTHPAHRTGQADLPHPALGQDFTPSPTAR